MKEARSQQNKYKKIDILKTHFYVSRGTLSALLLKNLKLQKFIGLKAKNFRQGFQNCILRVQRNILGLKKREQVPSELSDYEEKSLHAE